MSKGVWFLDVGRFSVGYGIGLLSYVVLALEFDFYIWLLLNVTLEAEGICICNSKQVPVYIAEITPKNLRGGFTAVNQVIQNRKSKVQQFAQHYVQHAHAALLIGNWVD